MDLVDWEDFLMDFWWIDGFFEGVLGGFEGVSWILNGIEYRMRWDLVDWEDATCVDFLLKEYAICFENLWILTSKLCI